LSQFMTASPLLMNTSVANVKSLNTNGQNIPLESGTETSGALFAESLGEAVDLLQKVAITPEDLLSTTLEVEEGSIDLANDTQSIEVMPLWISNIGFKVSEFKNSDAESLVDDDLVSLDLPINPINLIGKVDAIIKNNTIEDVKSLPEVQASDENLAIIPTLIVELNPTVMKPAEGSTLPVGNQLENPTKNLKLGIPEMTHNAISTSLVDGEKVTPLENASSQVSFANWLKPQATGQMLTGSSDVSAFVPKNESEMMIPLEKLINSSILLTNEIPSSKPASVEISSLSTAQPLGATTAIPAAAENTIAGRFQVSIQMTQGNAQWIDALTERAAWAANQKIQSAEVQLDPPELGYLQVKISVQNDQAVVSFVSGNAAVRDALEQNMPRLRELLQEQGLQLTDSGVSDQPSSNRYEAEEDAGDDTNMDVEVEQTLAPKIVLQTSLGVDDFV
jgi:hypothetical protein